MNAMARGIAHVSFAGGSLFLPARSPYDLQLLAEHVRECVRTKGLVQVLVGERRWLARWDGKAPGSRCFGCRSVLEAASYFLANGNARYCAPCALGKLTSVPMVGMARRADDAYTEGPNRATLNTVARKVSFSTAT